MPDIKTIEEFRLHVFTEASKIIDDSRCESYSLVGYKHLTQRLILNFRDCKQVFEWDFFINYDIPKEDRIVEVTFKKFYTEDMKFEEYMLECKKFNDMFDGYVPEVKP